MGNSETSMDHAFRFACPYCFQRISSEEDVGGLAVECPSCSRRFVAMLEPLDDPVVLAAAPATAPPSSPRSRGSRSKSDTPGWLWPSFAGVLSLVAVIGILVVATGGAARPGGGIDDLYARGLAMRDGDEPQADPSEAFRLFLEAAEAGHAGAQLEVAKDYLNDEGAVPVDFAKGAEWLEKSQSQGNLDARANLGWCLAKGYTGTQDLERGEALMRDAAGEGNLLAMSGLARLHSGEVEGFEADPEEAFQWYRKAAELGDRAGQFNLGRSYLEGFGTAMDPVEGWTWIERSAEQGFEPALADLQTRRDQNQLNELQHRFQRQIEENLRSRPQGSNPFSANPYTQRVPPQYREAQQRAYEGLRQQGYSDEVLRQQGYR